MADTAKTYRATERGYADGRIIEADEVFTTRAPKGSWMEPVKGAGSAAERAVEDAQKPRSDDPDLTKLAKPALQAIATERGVTNVEGLTRENLIAAIKASYDMDRAR